MREIAQETRYQGFDIKVYWARGSLGTDVVADIYYQHQLFKGDVYDGSVSIPCTIDTCKQLIDEYIRQNTKLAA